MFKYEIVIFWSSEDQTYITEVPELTGCMADGLSYKKVLENITQVIEEWIETAKGLDRKIPEPKS